MFPVLVTGVQRSRFLWDLDIRREKGAHITVSLRESLHVGNVTKVCQLNLPYSIHCHDSVCVLMGIMFVVIIIVK